MRTLMLIVGALFMISVFITGAYFICQNVSFGKTTNPKGIPENDD